MWAQEERKKWVRKIGEKRRKFAEVPKVFGAFLIFQVQQL